MTDNTRIVMSGKATDHQVTWKVYTGNVEQTFQTKHAADKARRLCKAAYKAGREDLAKEMRNLMKAARQ